MQGKAVHNPNILGRNLLQHWCNCAIQMHCKDLNKWQTFHNTPTKVGNSYFSVELNFPVGARIGHNLEYAWTLKIFGQNSKLSARIETRKNCGESLTTSIKVTWNIKASSSSAQRNAPQTLGWSTGSPLGRPWSAPRSRAAPPSLRHHQPTENEKLKTNSTKHL